MLLTLVVFSLGRIQDIRSRKSFDSNLDRYYFPDLAKFSPNSELQCKRMENIMSLVGTGKVDESAVAITKNPIHSSLNGPICVLFVEKRGETACL